MSSNDLSSKNGVGFQSLSRRSSNSSVSSFSPNAQPSDNLDDDSISNIDLKSYKLQNFDSNLPPSSKSKIEATLTQSQPQLYHQPAPPSPLPSVSSLHSSFDNLANTGRSNLPTGPNGDRPNFRRQVTLDLSNENHSQSDQKTPQRPNDRQKEREIQQIYRKQYQEEELNQQRGRRRIRRKRSSECLNTDEVDQVDSIPTISTEFDHNKKTQPKDGDVRSLENKPEDIKWKQQKLPAWQPIYRPINVISTFLIIGLLFVAIGVVMLISSRKVQERIIDYTDCRWQLDTRHFCHELLQKNPPQKCSCLVNLTLSEDFHQPLFLYYSLEGFYQNHRRYVSSVDQRQLLGRTDLSLADLKSCLPYRDLNGKAYGPCGTIANSMFTDQFKIYQTGTKSPIRQKETGIAWAIDKRYRFRNPPGDYLEKSVVKPRNWTVGANFLDPANPDNNGYQNEHFIVWMRTAAFPTFRKLWSQLDTSSYVGSRDGTILPKGEYTIEVEYRYQTVFPGMRIPKRLILSNTSWLGGRNDFLAILYLGAGSCSILFAVAFIYIVRKYGTPKEQMLSKRYRSTVKTDVDIRSFGNNAIYEDEDQ